MTKKLSPNKNVVLDQAAREYLKHKKEVNSVKLKVFNADFKGLDTADRIKQFNKRDSSPIIAQRVVEPKEVITELSKSAKTKREIEAFETVLKVISAVEAENSDREDSSDILDFEALAKGNWVGQAVGQINIDDGYDFGSGFLVGENIVLTNHHVLSRESLAKDSVFTLNHEKSILKGGSDTSQAVGANVKRQRRYRFDPDRFYYSDPDLDFAFVAVKDHESVGEEYSLSNFRPIPLLEQTGKILVGHPVSIIHHPSRRTKCVTMHMSFLTKLSDEGETPHICYYTGDTLPGSSGSPVFNANWEVVALHFASIKDLDDDGNVRLKDGSVIPNDEWQKHENSIVWISNQGMRISFIVKALRAKQFGNPDHAMIRDKLLKFWEHSAIA